jgi:hypothetical protein
VINPISWTTKETLATAQESLGSTLPNENLEFVSVGQYADAQIDLNRGVLICSMRMWKNYLQEMQFFPKGVYHSFDYPFYYFNIRENAENRANVYLENN